MRFTVNVTAFPSVTDAVALANCTAPAPAARPVFSRRRFSVLGVAP